MPTGARKACNQRPQSLMSREGGEGGNTGPTTGFWIWGPLTWTRVKRTGEKDIGRERWTDGRGVGEKRGVSAVRRSLCCSLVSGGQTEAGRGAWQRAPE